MLNELEAQSPDFSHGKEDPYATSLIVIMDGKWRKIFLDVDRDIFKCCVSNL